MGPALAPTSPDIFKQTLERFGCKVVKESEYNWVLYKEGAGRPLVVIPKKGELISVSIMMATLHQLEIDNGTYFRLKAEIAN